MGVDEYPARSKWLCTLIVNKESWYRNMIGCTQKTRRASANSSTVTLRTLLTEFVQSGDKSVITTLNSVRPLDVIEYILQRPVTLDESLLYLEALSNIPESLQQAYRCGKLFQDLKQACRKHLQGDTTERDLVHKFKDFVTTLDVTRARVA